MCMVHNAEVRSTEVFAERLLNMLNEGALSIMISVGHRVGLFDKMSKLPPSTSEEIAKAANLNERYVREWLGAMTTGKVVVYDSKKKTYELPAEHAALLIREAGADNIAVFSQYIPLLSSVEDKIVECFSIGGGVPYSEFGRFHEVMAEDSGQSIVSSMFNIILPAVNDIVKKMEQGINVLDLGCGRGKAITMMAKEYPRSTFTGYDLSEDAITFAKNHSKEMGLTNITFQVKDLSDFNKTAPSEQFDFITTFDAVHDQARPDNLLSGIYKALKRGGVYLMQDISASSDPGNNMAHPMGTFLYTISTMHCMTVSLAQNGMGLGAMWGREKAMEMLHQAGFKDIEIKNFKHDFQNDYYVIKK